MSDISNKDITVREATAECTVALKPHIIKLIKDKKIPKGDVFETARTAALLAAKKTHLLIPLCHPIPIEYMDIDFSFNRNGITIRAYVKTGAKTGVEMEALTATAVAALTVYDMCKPLDKGIIISDIRLLSKKGGKSGDYARGSEQYVGKIVAVSISKKKGSKKVNRPSVELKEDFGIIGDAHAGSVRQISLLSEESIEKMKQKGANVKAGDFAENMTTEGIDLLKLKIGARLKVGRAAVIEVTQIGKVCHSRCNIYYEVGDCVMPREGIFAKVLKGGIIKPGDEISVLER